MLNEPKRRRPPYGSRTDWPPGPPGLTPHRRPQGHVPGYPIVLPIPGRPIIFPIGRYPSPGRPTWGLGPIRPPWSPGRPPWDYHDRNYGRDWRDWDDYYDRNPDYNHPAPPWM